jgi:hypothetical protein
MKEQSTGYSLLEHLPHWNYNFSGGGDESERLYDIQSLKTSECEKP